MIAEVPSTPGYAGATLTLDIDPAEHQRRQQAGLGVATGHGFGGLGHLMALPENLPVPLADLTDQQRAYVKAAPAGICTIEDGHVTRHAVRPCRILMATVRYPNAGKLALDSAARFAPFCPRQVIVTRRPDPKFDASILMEYAFYGVGVTVHPPGGEPEVWLEPRPWRPHRHTAAGWWFTETAYGQYLQQHATEEATR